MAALDEARALAARVLCGSTELVGVADCPEKGGKKAVATQDLDAKQTILVEAPVFRTTAAHWRDPAFLARPEVAELTATVERCSRAYGHLPGAAKFPPEARAALDAIAAHAASDQLRGVDARAADAVFALEDAFRQPVVGETVAVDGLRSDAGRPLNGRRGVVVADAGGGRRRVRFSRGAAGDKAIRAAHLKGAGGIFRTNAFGDDGDAAVAGGGKLLPRLARANHACGAAANIGKGWVDSKDGVRRARVVALRPVRRGDELLIDYIPGPETAALDTAGRRALLKLKYNFDCDCPTCGPLPPG